MSTTAVFLRIEDLASELTISATEVHRLIAWKLIPATRLGDDGKGQYRITHEALERYVKAGAKRLRLPEYDPFDTRDWFNNDYNYLQAAFGTALIDAAEVDQMPSNDALRKAFESAKTQKLEYELKNIGAIAELLKQPVPRSIYGGRPDFKTDVSGAAGRKMRFDKWADLWAVCQIRDEAHQLLNAKVTGQTWGLRKLYDNPKDFDAVTAQAYAEASTRNLAVFSKSLTLPGEVFNSVLPVECRAQFSFPARNILTQAMKAVYLSLAF